MINIVKQNDNVSSYVTELVADTPEDVKNLSTEYYPGSSCLIVSTGEIYILSPSKIWVKI